MSTKAFSEIRRPAPRRALLAGCFIVALLTHLDRSQVAAQALLYDNTDHVYDFFNMNVIGPIGTVDDDGYWFEAQPFKLGAHDNIATVSVGLTRWPSRPRATGTMRFSLWDDNGHGVPGQKVGELGVVDLEAVDLESVIRPSDRTTDEPVLMPLVTFERQIDDLNPGGTYYVMIDWRGVAVDSLGDLYVGMSRDPAGTNRSGGNLYAEPFSLPPFEDSDWYPASRDFGPLAYLVMSATSADDPYDTFVSPVGTVYRQNFTRGGDGLDTTLMPTGWAFSDTARTKDFDGRDLTDEERLMRIDTRIFDTSITEAFPAGSSLGRGTPVFNAGAPGDPDRALALGVTRTSEDAMLQFVAKVAGGDANSIQLQFDIEAWDAVNSRINPGEAAFKVAMDLDTGEGFAQLLDLGRVTTGPSLLPPAVGDFIDGNAAANRISYDSGLLDVDLPEGSLLRVRWMADLEAATRGWVFGLDNVSLGMFAELPLLGDFDQDGILTANDIDLLSAELRDPSGDLVFDLNNDGEVNISDRDEWVHNPSIANTYFGDSNLDGEFNSGDLTKIFQAGEYEDNIAFNSTWSEGDWNGDGEFDSGDLVAAFADGGYERGPRAATNAVPEPSSVILLLLGIVGILRQRQTTANWRA